MDKLTGEVNWKSKVNLLLIGPEGRTSDNAERSKMAGNILLDEQFWASQEQLTLLS